MSQRKIQRRLAGLALVTVLAGVPVSAEAGGSGRRADSDVWSLALQWVVERWTGIDMGRPPRPEGRTGVQDKKGSSLDPNGIRFLSNDSPASGDDQPLAD